MIIEPLLQNVFFERQDMPFVNRHGFLPAVEMVLAHTARTDLPFIQDTYQLAHRLGLAHRELFRLLWSANDLYRPVTLPKKNGGVRRIHAPYALLRYTQRYILQEILSLLPISRYATAYHIGAHLVDNASPHCGKRYLLKMDLQNFFPSIRFDQVYNAAFRQHFPRHIAAMLTALCCREDVLPQGAPTSPALSNLVMKYFDDVFGTYCERQGLTYTRYCDDITVSGNKPLYTAYAKACTLLAQQGFTVNAAKTRFVTRANRQTVTGLTVNDTPHVPRDYRRALRQELYYAFTYGIEDAIRRGNRTDFIDSDGDAQILRYLDSLEGRVRYVLSVQPHERYCQEAVQRLHELRTRALTTVPWYQPIFK